MVVTYKATRAAHPDHFLLYRVGEFYEVLLDDARTVSRLLGIQLTRRRQKESSDIPMCGVPAASANGAIGRLLAAGRKVVVSEQPKEPTGERPIRLMTPGTSVDADVLSAGKPNNLLVAHAEGQKVGLAWIDLSTGEAGTSVASLEGCAAALAHATPSEVIVSRWPDASDALARAIRSSGTPYCDLPAISETQEVESGLLAIAHGQGWRTALQGFSPLELTAYAALIRYVHRTLGILPSPLLPPRRALIADIMEIDAPTLRGLEVFTSPSGREGSLLSVIDRTVTAAGARLLFRQLAAPLIKPETIGRRLEMVRCLVERTAQRCDCREMLAGQPDVLRACGRLSLGKGGPRDLADIGSGLWRATALAKQLRDAPSLPAGLATVARDLGMASVGKCGELATMLRRALRPDPPASADDPSFISEGYSSRLDNYRAAYAQVAEAIAALQARYVVETGVKALKIRSNSLIGYHVEVPAAGAQALGVSFVLRQGLASSSRYTTAELDSLATALDDASKRVIQATQTVFTELSRAALSCREALSRVSAAAAALDLVAGLAQAAAEGLWSEPELVDDNALEIKDGRHPVAEALFNRDARTFVANDCSMLDHNRIWLLTGPNMAGKSTFLRQVAIIVLMAQVGSFVPAVHARIGVVDKLFSRIGASDDLAAGRSTFMVEMLETSAILTQATERSLVILDEVGRGTSTQDGLAIAQACLEHLHDVVRCRALFATHFHELADATDGLLNATCMAMEAEAGRHGDLFTYKVRTGRAGRSYGLKVAALAGMPRAVLERAASLLGEDSAAIGVSK